MINFKKILLLILATSFCIISYAKPKQSQLMIITMFLAAQRQNCQQLSKDPSADLIPPQVV